MKKRIIVIIIVGILIISGLSYYFLQKSSNTENVSDETLNQQESSVENLNINIENFIYSPKTLMIKVGETVTWTNLDSIRHTVTSDTGNELDSALLSDGDVYSHTFNNAGTYKYHCTPHPFMKGEIIVIE